MTCCRQTARVRPVRPQRDQPRPCSTYSASAANISLPPHQDGANKASLSLSLSLSLTHTLLSLCLHRSVLGAKPAAYLGVGTQEHTRAVLEGVVAARCVAVVVPAVVDFQGRLDPARGIPQLGPPRVLVVRV